MKRSHIAACALKRAVRRHGELRDLRKRRPAPAKWWRRRNRFTSHRAGPCKRTVATNSAVVEAGPGLRTAITSRSTTMSRSAQDTSMF